MIDQTYTRRSNAIRAARAELSPDAKEGELFEIFRVPDGRFAYRPLSALTAATSPKRPEVAAKGKSAMSGRDRAASLGFRPGTKTHTLRGRSGDASWTDLCCRIGRCNGT